MDKKEVAIRSIISTLDDIDTSISGISVDPPTILANKVNKLFENISTLNEVASFIDESSNQQVPLDFFRHLDSAENSNPHTYGTKLIAEGLATSDQLLARIKYLDNLRNKISIGIEEIASKHNN